MAWMLWQPERQRAPMGGSIRREKGQCSKLHQLHQGTLINRYRMQQGQSPKKALPP